MVEFNDTRYGNPHSVSRWVRRLFGMACLIAVPGIWIAVQDALPEALILGLALSLVILSVGGLCFVGER